MDDPLSVASTWEESEEDSDEDDDEDESSDESDDQQSEFSYEDPSLVST